jgi:hypothetical protein
MKRAATSRVGIALAGLVVGAVIASGVAWAVQSPVDGSGVIRGCYNPTTGAFGLDVKGVCPLKGKTTALTWNQQGPPGTPAPPREFATADGPWQPVAAGQPIASGELFAQSENTCSSIVGYPCTTVLGSDFTTLTSPSLTVSVAEAHATLDVRLSASVSCFGASSDKYVDILVDGTQQPDPTELAATPPLTNNQSEIPVSAERTVPVTAGTHTIKLAAQVGADSVCAMGWHLVAEAVS